MSTSPVLSDSPAQRERLRAVLADGPTGHLRHCLTVGVEIRGLLDEDDLRARFARLVARRPALGGVFTGEGTHRLAAGATVELRRQRVDAPTAAARWAIANDIAGFESERPFGLGETPLVRGTLLSTEDDRHLLVVCLDQLVCDAWSANLVVADLLGDGDATPDDYPRVWCELGEWVAGPDGRTAAARRRERVADAWDRWPVPVDGDPADPYDAVERFLPLDDAVTKVLRDRVRDARGTLLAAGALALAAGLAEDATAPLALRTTLAGRETPDEQGVVGWFANEAVLRLPARTGGVLDWVTALRAEVFAALADQRVPYPLVADAVPAGDPDGASCALVFLPKGLSGGEQADYRLGGAVATRTAVSICPTGADIDFFMIEDAPPIPGSPAGMLTVGATTRRGVASPATVDHLLDRWIASLTALADRDWATAAVAQIG